MASYECLERRRKIGRLRQRCAVDQHRDHPDVPLERRFDLHSNVVPRVVEPRVSVIVPDVEPARPDHRDERDARGDLFIERFHEVDARLDGVDVHEQLLAVEMLQQSVVEEACRRLVVTTPVTNKDATGHNILVCFLTLVEQDRLSSSNRVHRVSALWTSGAEFRFPRNLFNKLRARRDGCVRISGRLPAARRAAERTNEPPSAFAPSRSAYLTPGYLV